MKREKTGGRQSGSLNKKTIAESEAIAEASALIGQVVEGAFDGNGLEFMQAVYRHPELDLNYRIKCAIAAAQYESSRLSTIAHTGPDGGPVKVEDVSLTDAARRIAFLLAAGAKQTEPKE